jgi:hypothetical protein
LANPGFTLAEDAALKSRLQTVYVSDDREQQRYVKVFFRYPDGETEKAYPFITLELIGINHARNRQHSSVDYYYTNDVAISQSRKDGYSDRLNYFPSEYDEDGLQTIAGTDGFIHMEDFVPVDLTYQVSTYCRSQRHDRQITATMMRYVFPLRRGFIEIPEDGTIRRCDLLNWRQADLLDQEAGYSKRIFRKVFTVQINSEIPQNDINPVKKVETVSGELKDTRNEPTVLTTFSTQEF